VVPAAINLFDDCSDREYANNPDTVNTKSMNGSSGNRILIVDDIAENIEVLGNILSREGYSLGFACRGADAITRARSGLYDLILLDILMPEMDGFQVCEILRSEAATAEIPVIFLSARVDNESLVRGFEAGGQDYVTKPFNAAELLARVRTHLELRRRKRALEELNRTLEIRVAERTEELSRANERLSVLEHAKSDFLALISHEIRTPLNAMINLVDILSDLSDEGIQKDLISDLRTSIRRFSKLSETALTITSFKVNSRNVSRESFRLDSLFSAIIEHNREGTREKELQVLTDINPPNLEVEVDRELFILCLDNIFHNAVQFSSHGDSIEIRASEADGVIDIEIADNGPGLTDTVYANIFDIFTAGDMKHHGEGFGLGLATARLIVEAHGGSIGIRDRIRQGLCVMLSLPVHEAVKHE
jgi:two-component system sensor histidine kinase/response regulator